MNTQMKVGSYLDIIESFDENSLPSLSEVVMAALELFSKEGLPDVKFKDFKKPLVCGSGNAIATAKILFENSNAIFADESNYKERLKLDIDGVYIFSASGGKHAPIIAKAAKEKGLKTQLITCTKNSQAQDVVGLENTIVTSKLREPYTYNTSTYMGWILAKTRENSQEIFDYIQTYIEPKLKSFDFTKFDGYLLVTPDKFSSINHLFDVKYLELFGRKIARDVKTFEEMRHAVTVVPSQSEIALQFGKGNFDFENKDNIFQVPLPNNVNLASMMAIGYYTIGKIQEQMPQYFKENISNYIKRNKKGEFGKAMNVIVE